MSVGAVIGTKNTPVTTESSSVPFKTLELLNIIPSNLSVDFVENKKAFQLHTLTTEKRHPNTMNLSSEIKENTQAGIQSLLSVDVDVTRKFEELAKNTKSIEPAINAIVEAMKNNKKIYVYGCGATGRLAKQVESSFWRPFWSQLRERFPRMENLLIGEMTGGDRALISSLEGLEDLPIGGKIQLQEDHKIGPEDVIFAITEGGETSSVIGTILAGEGKNRFFIYNNPDEDLRPFDRSRAVLNNDEITKIPLWTGNQAIAGSTRMQATTSETYLMGLIIEEACKRYLESFLFDDELEDLGFGNETLADKLMEFGQIQRSVFEKSSEIAKFTDLEAQTYLMAGKAIYVAGKEPIVTVFTDCTERSPTFRTPPLDRVDALEKKSLIEVYTPATDGNAAWEAFLGRPFHGLKPDLFEEAFQKIEDPYIREAALRSLKNGGDDQKDLYDFSYNSDKAPGLKDLGVHIVFENYMEAEEGKIPELDLFPESKVVIVVSQIPLDYVLDGVQFINVCLNVEHDPLKVKHHVALKMLLNAHSTGVMAKLGKVVGNIMTNVNPGNLKLIGRATFWIQCLVQDFIPMEYYEANAVLFDSMNYVEKAGKKGKLSEVALSIVRTLESHRQRKGIDWEEAEFILEKHTLEDYLNSLKFN